jgi:hypothetical protein
MADTSYGGCGMLWHAVAVENERNTVTDLTGR